MADKRTDQFIQQQDGFMAHAVKHQTDILN